jgi:hypothetical protein
MAYLFLFASASFAQQTVAPTNESVGPRSGTNIGNYNIRQSFETGYRFANVGGNRGKYRSDVNFLNGVRVLGTSLSIFSRDGKGNLFDELTINTQGLGNDPYQFTTMKIEKNRRYRYEMQWRLNDYFNPGLTIAYGQHFQNLERRMQDHQFTLFPQGRFEFYGGYSRNVQDGPALSTINFFDSRGQIFPLFENVQRKQDEFRAGGAVKLRLFKFYWQRGWEQFREDTRGFLTSAATGLDPNVTTVGLSGYRRDQPYSGSTPHWRLNLLTEKNRYAAVSARFTHSDGQRNFIHDELANATNRGQTRNLQYLIFGDARRPVTNANLTFSLFPVDRVTLTNHTAYHSTKMDGDSTLRQFTNNTLDTSVADFQFLGIRAATNTSLADISIKPWISVQGGYQFAGRRIRSRVRRDELGFVDSLAGEQTNRLHAGTAGFRLRPIKGWTIVADGELGRQSQPFYTTSEKDYHGFGLRSEYKRKQFRVAGQMRFHMNFNSANLFQHSSRSRNYTLDTSWTPNAKFALDAGYQKLHLDTITGLAYFVNFQQVDGDRSFYLSNVHAAHAGARLALLSKLDLFAGFSITKDTAQARAGFAGGAAQSVFTNAQVFPLTFLSPQMRLSYRIRENLRWNFGYQHYNYAEAQLTAQDYRAHTGFLSVLWSF